MRKIFLFLVALMAVPAFAVNCGPVVDNAGVGVNEGNLSQLSNLGADPHIITDNSYAGTPDQLVNEYHSACPNWKSANGGVKNNLIVFVLFPTKHKIGFYTGQEWSSAIDAGQIRSDMIPAFRDGDFRRGLMTGVNRTADAIFAYQHPKQTVVNETPADYSGLWKFLMWGLIGASLGGLIWFAWFLYEKRKTSKAERLAAQKDAVQARAEAADYVNNNPDDGYAAERFARLSNSESMNPDGDFEAEDYKIIAAAYRALLRSKLVYKSEGVTAHVVPGTIKDEDLDHSQAQGIPYVPQEKSSTVVNKTTYVDNSPAYIPVPVIVEEPIRDESPSWGHSWGGSSSTDSSSSSSSDWSSSSSSSSFDSSSSSSWSDSSSSSSFDSGSSFGGDSGGGFSGGDSSW